MQFTVQQSFNLEGYYATWHYIRLRILSQIEDRVKDHHLFLNVDFSFQRVLNISITKLKVQNWKLIEMEITEFEHTIENTKLKILHLTRLELTDSSFINAFCEMMKGT